MNDSLYWLNHFSKVPEEVSQTFVHLGVNDFPDVLESLSVQNAKGVAFESAENRVFRFDNVVIKFYRPGRWSKKAIEQEVEFLNDLKEGGVSAVRPIGNAKTWQGIHYLAYEAISEPFNESPETFNEEEVKKLSHLMAKVHEVGKLRPASERPQFDPQGMCDGCYEVITRAGYLPKECRSRYEGILSQIVKKLDNYKDVPLQRIHGDSYSGNVVWQNGEPIFLDFDDFQVGPKAIDLKLLSFPWRLESLPESMDRRERREIQNQLVLKYYRELGDFPKEWEGMFPLMSAYRDIQFDAWFSSRWSEPGFSQNYEEDDITSATWWNQNMDGLENLLS